MTNYKLLDDATKQYYKKQITNCAQSLGGKNYFLQLLEEIRVTHPHPLMAKDYSFLYPFRTYGTKRVNLIRETFG